MAKSVKNTEKINPKVSKNNNGKPNDIIKMCNTWQ